METGRIKNLEQENEMLRDVVRRDLNNDYANSISRLEAYIETLHLEIDRLQQQDKAAKDVLIPHVGLSPIQIGPGGVMVSPNAYETWHR